MTTHIAPVLKSAKLSTGVTLPYAVQGDPDGIPMIMLHGVTDSWRAYELVLPYLPPPIRAYVLTQRGHGDADRPVSGYAPGDFAADLVAFMDALEIPSAVLVAHSLSTGIATRVAMDHPKRVRGLVLIGAFRNWQHSPDFITWIHEAIEPLTDQVDSAFAREFQESTLATPIPPSFLDIAVSESLKLPAHVWRETFGSFKDADVESGLEELQAPTLLIWGDHDAIFSRAIQEYLVEIIPNATLSVYEGIGHAVHWEAPQRVAADLTAFVARVSG